MSLGKKYLVSKTQLDGSGKPNIVGKESGLLSSLTDFGNLLGEKLFSIGRVVLLSGVVLGIPLAFLAGRKVERDAYAPSRVEIRRHGNGPAVYIDETSQPQLIYDFNASDPNWAVFTTKIRFPYNVSDSNNIN